MHRWVAVEAAAGSAGPAGGQGSCTPPAFHACSSFPTAHLLQSPQQQHRYRFSPFSHPAQHRRASSHISLYNNTQIPLSLSLSPYNEKRRATDLRREKSAKQSTAAVARFLLKPAVIAMIGFLAELLAAAAEGLAVLFTKGLPNPAAHLPQVCAVHAELMEHTMPPAHAGTSAACAAARPPWEKKLFLTCSLKPFLTASSHILTMRFVPT